MPTQEFYDWRKDIKKWMESSKDHLTAILLKPTYVTGNEKADFESILITISHMLFLHDAESRLVEEKIRAIENSNFESLSPGENK